MNKLGDIAMSVLVALAFSAALFALIAFMSFDNSYLKKDAEYSAMRDEVGFTYRYIIEESRIAGEISIQRGGDIKTNFQQIMQERAVPIAGAKQFYELIQVGEFSFTSKGDKHILSVPDVIIESKSGFNKYIRNTEIILEFDN